MNYKRVVFVGLGCMETEKREIGNKTHGKSTNIKKYDNVF